MVPADHDGVDNDGDGEIDEEGEYEVVYVVNHLNDRGENGDLHLDEGSEDENFNDLRLDTEGQYVDADGNIVESIVQVERTEYIWAEDDPTDPFIDDNGSESWPSFPPEDPGLPNHKKDNDDEGSEDDDDTEEDDTEEEETDDD